MDDAAYDVNFEESGEKPRRPGFPVEPRRLLRIVTQHRVELLRALLGASAVAGLLFLLLPKTFTAESVLLYEGLALYEGEQVIPTPEAFVQSAIVPNRLQEIRQRLGWEVSLEELEGRVSATLVSDTSMRLSAEGDTAEEAKALAQALLEAFLEHQASFNEKQLKRLALENDASLERAKRRRDAAQQAVDAFRAQSGRPDLLEEKEQLLERTAELRSLQDQAAVEVAAQRALIEELEIARRELPRQILASARKGSAVEGPLAKARADLAEARATLSEAHPRVKALKQQVASLQAQRRGQPVEVSDKTLATNPARAAVEQQLATARAALAAAEERKAALGVLLEDLRRESEALAPEEGEARQVLGELESASLRVEELTNRGAALRDASVTPQTGFRVLSAPVLPEQSERSSVQVMLVLAFPILVVIVYAIVLLVRALRPLSVQAPREVAWWGNGPVLGTSVWPRDLSALDTFVDELEDLGIYGAGRTLVVPATETERDIACSFAMRLAGAPWLAAAILDVGHRALGNTPLTTPPPRHGGPTVQRPPRRLSSQATPVSPHAPPPRRKPTVQGFVPPREDSSSGPMVTPPPRGGGASSSRPPRKKTVIGLPAVQVQAEQAEKKQSEAPVGDRRESSPDTAAGVEPFRRKRGAHATVRMMVPTPRSGTAAQASSATESDTESSPGEEAFLLTRPVPVSEPEEARVGPAVLLGHDEGPSRSASTAVMRAAVRLLGDDAHDVYPRPSRPPTEVRGDEVTGVALAWNGPLSGPVLRRAARLAHRVIVVVSSGLGVVELTRVKTRLGRERGVGYVLVNLDDPYVNLRDRVGPVEEFWQDGVEWDARDLPSS